MIKILIITTMALLGNSCKSQVDLSPVPFFDLEKYMGLWYEVARYENSFERGMNNVTAHYSLMPDGKVKVVNSGYRNGELRQATGKAKAGKPAENGYLKVAFFLNFYAPYRVIMLAEDYSYALVSSGPKYLWILSRTPHLNLSTLNTILTEATRRGFDIDKLIFN